MKPSSALEDTAILNVLGRSNNWQRVFRYLLRNFEDYDDVRMAIKAAFPTEFDATKRKTMLKRAKRET